MGDEYTSLADTPDYKAVRSMIEELEKAETSV